MEDVTIRHTSDVGRAHTPTVGSLAFTTPTASNPTSGPTSLLEEKVE